MLPVLTGENGELERKEMYWEFREKYAARVGKWKLVNNLNNKGFYDLSIDISEKNDLTNQFNDQ
jgi:hypothetical protein